MHAAEQDTVCSDKQLQATHVYQPPSPSCKPLPLHFALTTERSHIIWEMCSAGAQEWNVTHWTGLNAVLFLVVDFEAGKIRVLQMHSRH